MSTTGDAAPDANAERLIGRHFSEMRLFQMISVISGNSMKVDWMPAADNMGGDVYDVSGTITGVETVEKIDGNVFTFERDGDDESTIEFEHSLVIPPGILPAFESVLD